MKIVIATNNKGKLAEFQSIMGEYGYQVCSMKEAGLIDVPPIEESGTTYAENARIKALDCFKRCGLTVIADDSGLEVDALNGAPGIYSARYAGENTTDADRRQKMLQELASVPLQLRIAHFTCAICCCLSDGRLIEVTGQCHGHIGFEERGTNGFGYDSIFIDESGLTFGELPESKKSEISHRAKAINELIKQLKKENILC